MIAPTQIRKPENWQDFEKLCKKLWGEIWDCPDTIKRNGRSGQKQCGVDVYGVPKGETHYYGIQCKGKDDYTKSTLTEKEIDDEIKKAAEFKPRLKSFLFATTANKDVDIEEYIRVKDLECRSIGLFEVHIACWEDIVDLLEERRRTFNWYINNCQYKDNTNVLISLSGKTETTIYPKYVRTAIYYEQDDYPDPHMPNNPSYFLQNLIKAPNFSSCSGEESVPNIQWQDISIKIENVGTTVIEDFKLYFSTDKGCVEQLDCGVEYVSSIYASPSFRMEMNRRIDEDREVYESIESQNELVYMPNDSVLVQTDRRIFSFKIGLKYGIKEIPLYWRFKSRDFCKEGILKIKVVPQYEEDVKVVKVRSYSEIKETEIRITPKIEDE